MAPRGSTKGMTVLAFFAALVALAFWWPVLDVGFLSDDWLLPQFLVAGSEDPRAVDWPRALRDFWGPWFGAEGAALYRPLITLSVAVDIALGGLEAPWIFHATNLGLHAACAALSAMIAFRLAATRRRLCAALAGVIFALHPVGAESVAWIVARNSSLTSFFMLGAVYGFVRHRQKHACGVPWLALASSILALLCKESALNLPLLFAGAEVFGRALGSIEPDGRGLAGFVKRHATWLPLWLAYLGLRLLLFGALSGSAHGEKLSLAQYLSGIDARGALLFVPQALRVGTSLESLAEWAALLALVGACSALLARVALQPLRAGLASSALLITGLAACVIASSVPLDVANGSGSRVLLTLVLLPALVPATLAGTLPGRRASLLSLGLLPLVVCWAFDAHERKQRFVAAGAEMRAVVEALELRAAGRDAERPAAVLVTPSDRDGVPFLNANAVFTTLTLPLARKAPPLIGLNSVLHRLPDQPELFHDAAPIRAVLDADGVVLLWDEASRQMQAIARTALDADRTRLRLHDSAARWNFATSASPFAFERVRAVGPADAKLRLVVRGANGSSITAAAGRPEAKGMLFDLASSVEVLGLALAGGIRGFELVHETRKAGELRRAYTIEVAGPARDFRVEQRIDEGSTSRPCTVTRDGHVRRASGALVMSPTSGDAALRVVLLSAGVGYAFDAKPGEALVLPPRVRLGLQKFARSDGARTLWIYWQDARGRRSALDAFTYELEASEG